MPQKKASLRQPQAQKRQPGKEHKMAPRPKVEARRREARPAARRQDRAEGGIRSRAAPASIGSISSMNWCRARAA